MKKAILFFAVILFSIAGYAGSVSISVDDSGDYSSYYSSYWDYPPSEQVESFYAESEISVGISVSVNWNGYGAAGQIDGYDGFGIGCFTPNGYESASGTVSGGYHTVSVIARGGSASLSASW
ncbi:MAG: hypothetical protein H7Y07_05315 [Pyrinomonadaceae bacterium]|nr:hypothetical protein [Sphingobacteriaceae bacterium]